MVLEVGEPHMSLTKYKNVIFGSGGYAIELYFLLKDDGLTISGFVGPQPRIDLPAPWLGNDCEVLEKINSFESAYIAVGLPTLREKIFNNIISSGYNVATFVHSKSYVSSSAYLGRGVVVYPGVIVQSKVSVGDAVLLNANATIGHDVFISKFSTISPGASIAGCVQFGERCYLGMLGGIVENLIICDDVTIGAGAIVVHSISMPGKYAGVPARKL